jgi:protein-disulfide isomerase
VKAVLLALVALASVGAAPVDWTKMVTRMPNGAYVLGNPKAKVRLVEYLSYSCSHCAHFSGESSAPLKAKYVAKGSVAVEMRNAVRDRYDFAAALLARCGGASRFHAQSEALFAGQEALLQRASSHEARSTMPENASTNDTLADMAAGSGLINFMNARGVPAEAVNACLTSKAEQDIVLAMTKEAWEVRKITFTPTFYINGRNAGPSTWATLEPKIRAAVAAK